MRNLIKICALTALAIAQPAAASLAQNGNISTLVATNSGAVLFSTNGSRTSVPSCATTYPARFAIDASTTTGQVAASALLTAYAMKKRVLVQGTGSCTIWGDTETVDFVIVED